MKRYNRIIVLLLALMMCLSLCACGEKPTEETPDVTDAPPVESEVIKDPDPTEEPNIPNEPEETPAVEPGEFRVAVLGELYNEGEDRANVVSFLLDCTTEDHKIISVEPCYVETGKKLNYNESNFSYDTYICHTNKMHEEKDDHIQKVIIIKSPYIKSTDDIFLRVSAGYDDEYYDVDVPVNSTLDEMWSNQPYIHGSGLVEVDGLNILLLSAKSGAKMSNDAYKRYMDCMILNGEGNPSLGMQVINGKTGEPIQAPNGLAFEVESHLDGKFGYTYTNNTDHGQGIGIGYRTIDGSDLKHDYEKLNDLMSVAITTDDGITSVMLHLPKMLYPELQDGIIPDYD